MKTKETCPYCNKAVRERDIPNHLDKKKECRMKHAAKLLAQLRKMMKGEDDEIQPFSTQNR